MKEKLPRGLRICDRCEEPRGWSGSRKAECLCAGMTCRNCGYGKRHRPISDYYDPVEGRWWHVPYFGGMGTVCWGCKERGKNRRKFEIEMLRWVEDQPGATAQEIAAEREDATTRKVVTALRQLQREKLIEERDDKWFPTMPDIEHRTEGDFGPTVPEARDLQRYWKTTSAA